MVTIGRRALLQSAPLATLARRKGGSPVPSYERLAAIRVTSAADQSGKNVGNLTAAFTSDLMPRINVYEIYHMIVTGGPPLAVASIVALGKQWSTVVLDFYGQNEWDPATPLLLHAGSEMYFLWNIPAGGQAPVVTIWPRLDTQNPQNRPSLPA